MRLIGGPGKDHPARRRRQGWALSTDDRAVRGPGSPEMGAALSALRRCCSGMWSRCGRGTTQGARMSHLVLGRAWCSCGSRLGCCPGPPCLPARSIRSGPARPRPAPAGPVSVGSGDAHLSSRHPGAVGDRLDRPLDADVRDHRHGAARDRVQDGADAHRRMAAQRPRPPRVHADVAGEVRGLHAGGDGRGDRATRPGRGRAGPDPGASSGTPQRPAAVPRVSRTARTARGRSARGLARQELNLELMVRRCVPAHPMVRCQRAHPHPGRTRRRCPGSCRRR